MRQQETKAKRKMERYRREGGEQKSQVGNTAGRKGHAQCSVEPHLGGGGVHSGRKGHSWYRQNEKNCIWEKNRRVHLREGKNKTEKNETGRGGMMNIATAGNSINCLPGSAKM